MRLDRAEPRDYHKSGTIQSSLNDPQLLPNTEQNSIRVLDWGRYVLNDWGQGYGRSHGDTVGGFRSLLEGSKISQLTDRSDVNCNFTYR